MFFMVTLCFATLEAGARTDGRPNAETTLFVRSSLVVALRGVYRFKSLRVPGRRAIA
jgi:hypothetical protein